MDTIAQFLTRIRNAGLARHEKVDIPSSRSRVGIASVLKQTGYISDFKVVRDGRQGMMRVFLKYDDAGRHAISNVRRVSRPGRRLYIPCGKIPVVRSGFGLSVISTSQGIMSGSDATNKNIGGELICTVW